MRMLMTVGLMSTLLACQSSLAQTESSSSSEPSPQATAGDLNQQTLANLTRKVTQLGAHVERLTTNVSESLVQISELKRQMDQQTERINDEIEKQRQILDAISKTDSDGYRIPRLSASMKASPGFRDEFRLAVEQSLQQDGDFSIINRSSESQQISVNGTPHVIDPGDTLRLTLPVGNVETRLPNGEQRNWALTAPNYQATIEIIEKPASEHRTYKPIAPATSAAPLVYPTVPEYYYYSYPWSW